MSLTDNNKQMKLKSAPLLETVTNEILDEKSSNVSINNIENIFSTMCFIIIYW